MAKIYFIVCNNQTRKYLSWVKELNKGKIKVFPVSYLPSDQDNNHNKVKTRQVKERFVIITFSRNSE